MVWEKEIPLIIMLCPIIGPMGGEESCPYWEQVYQDHLHRITVQELASERTTPTPGVTRRLIKLSRREHANGQVLEERVIEHF